MILKGGGSCTGVSPTVTNSAGNLHQICDSIEKLDAVIFFYCWDLP